MKKLYFVYIVFLVLLAGICHAATIELSWQSNTEPDVAGYRIYQGTASGTYGAPLDAGNVVSKQITLTPSAGTTYYFAVSCYDTSGNESVKSAEASVFVPDSVPPAKPTGIKALIQAVIAWIMRLFGGAA